jgi:hypothetical protein
MRTVSFGIVLPLALALAGCAKPALVDADGQPLSQPLLVASIDNGWVAVDSSQSGIRAVLELRTEERGSDRRGLELFGLQLRFANDLIPPSRLQCQDPTTCRMVSKPVASPEEGGYEESADPREEAVTEVCINIVRAEFELPRAPTPSDSVALIVGESTTLLRWRR